MRNLDRAIALGVQGALVGGVFIGGGGAMLGFVLGLMLAQQLHPWMHRSRLFSSSSWRARRRRPRR